MNFKVKCPNCEMINNVFDIKCSKCGWEGFMPFDIEYSFTVMHESNLKRKL